MIINVKKRGNSEAELQVELDHGDLQEYLQKAGRDLSNAVAVDGFRAGKVPLDVLRKKIGDEKLLEIALDGAVNDSLAKAIKKERLDVLSYAGLQITANTAQQLKYHLQLVLFPEIKLGAYKNLGMVAEPVEVGDKDIQDALESIRQSRVTYQDTAVPAVDGCRLEIDFEVTNNGMMVDGGKSENHPLVLGKGGFMPGFEEQLKGLSKGETKQFFLQAPEDYYQKSIAGKKLDFRVTVKSVQMAILPELTDDFAKQLGNFASLAVLRQSIAQGLKAEKEQKEREKMRRRILDKISDQTELAIPAPMMEKQLDLMLADFDKTLHERGLELSLYLTQIKKSQDDLRREWRAKAEKQIRHGLIMRAVSKAEDLTVAEEEVEEGMGALLNRYALSGADEKKIHTEALRLKVKEELLNEKVLEFLENANASIS